MLKNCKADFQNPGKIVLGCCPHRSGPENGFAKPTFQDIWRTGDTVAYSCEDRYVLEGETLARCQPDGEWSNDVPSCEGKFPS